METGELTATTTETIRLSDNFTLVPGQYNANGIEVSRATTNTKYKACHRSVAALVFETPYA